MQTIYEINKRLTASRALVSSASSLIDDVATRSTPEGGYLLLLSPGRVWIENASAATPRGAKSVVLPAWTPADVATWLRRNLVDVVTAAAGVYRHEVSDFTLITPEALRALARLRADVEIAS